MQGEMTVRWIASWSDYFGLLAAVVLPLTLSVMDALRMVTHIRLNFLVFSCVCVVYSLGLFVAESDGI
jgi:uncharacterized membrane protein (DUF2068 family)